MNGPILLTACWGEKNIQLFAKALGRSLRWPKNYAVVKQCKWVIITDGVPSADVLKHAASNLLPDAIIEIRVKPSLSVGNYGPSMMDAVLSLAHECIVNKTPMLMACPDFIFGDGTLAAFQSIGREPGVCVAVPHIRVTQGIFDKLALFDKYGDNAGISNARLMHIAWQNPHKSWTTSEIFGDNYGCFVGGVSWERLSRTLVRVTHVLPSPFYVNFMPDDLVYFAQLSKFGFGSWDHSWPSHLYENQRMRLVGSSDIACMAEITDEDMNVPPPAPFDHSKPSAFHLEGLHFNIQRQFVCSYRGEP